MTSGGPAGGAVPRVLFVCTANISRSPYAARRAAMAVPAGLLSVASAGIPGVPGREMDPAMAAELAARGGSGAGHLSQEVTAPLLAWADLVLTMEFVHQLAIRESWPQLAGRVMTIGRFAAGVAGAPVTGVDDLLGRAARTPDGMAWDVADPYQRGRRAARQCADQLDSQVRALVGALAGAELPSAPVTEPSRWWRRRGVSGPERP